MLSEPIDEPLVDEIMDFPDNIYRNNNYVKNLHATGNNENKNVIFIQQFYMSKQRVYVTSYLLLFKEGYFIFNILIFKSKILEPI